MCLIRSPKLPWRMLPVLFLFVLNFPAQAEPHHGNGGYNLARTITLNGTVTSFDWSNPHCLLHLDVKDDSGEVQRWTIEMAGPNVMKRRGWNSQSFKAGDQVAIDTHPAKKGIPLGISSSNSYVLKTVVNGRTLPVQ
jgi:hypothetical protein